MTKVERQFCDIVMKGGITSGIVYPNAVIELSRKYHFKNIGGTSAGAIAAAVAAAAALGERRRELCKEELVLADVGMAGLKRVSEALTTEGFIFSLFQPCAEGRPLNKLLQKLADKPNFCSVIWNAFKAICRMAFLPLLLSFAVFVLIGAFVGGWAGLASASLPALLLSLMVGVAFSLKKTAHILHGNKFGLCSGLSTTEQKPALTDWLHQVLQDLSGNGNTVLRLRDLWEAPRYPDEPDTAKSIQLTTITTDLSHHEPRSIPFEGKGFWFREDEFSQLFPQAVVNAMVESNPLVIEGVAYHRLPASGKLPVLVAARMSLSFPTLISAVPLYEPDYRKTPTTTPSSAKSQKLQATGFEGLSAGGANANAKPSAMRVCWFSDGGISSNCPIHLFDSALPRWPTFAINLAYPKTLDTTKERVYLPKGNKEGWQPVYAAFSSDNPLKEVGGFLFSIISTMQNWRDLLQSRAPGHRDRIVHVELGPNEGGTNLNMKADVLDSIAKKGTAAGAVLVDQFKFENHWWMRWRNVASGSERFIKEFAAAAKTPVSVTYTNVRETAASGSLTPPSYRFNLGQSEEAQRRFNEFVEMGLLWADTDVDLTNGAPKPLPQLRIMPNY